MIPGLRSLRSLTRGYLARSAAPGQLDETRDLAVKQHHTFLTRASIPSLCLLALLSISVNAQEPNWRTIQPTTEEYKIEMPAPPARFEQLLPLSQDVVLSSNVHDVVFDDIRFQVMSFRKRAQDPILMLRDFPSFVTGFQKAFLDNTNVDNRSLSFERNIGKKVQQYKLQLGKYSGLVRFHDADIHFYVVLVVGGAETDPSVDRFLNSFKVRSLNLSRNPFPDGTAINTPQAARPPDLWLGTKPSDAPIRVGIVNGRAIELPAAAYPKGARVSGRVSIKVLIDEQGNVVSADAIDGPAELRQAATQAAMKARFFPTRFLGQPVTLVGTAIYGFVFGG